MYLISEPKSRAIAAVISVLCGACMIAIASAMGTARPWNITIGAAVAVYSFLGYEIRQRRRSSDETDRIA